MSGTAAPSADLSMTKTLTPTVPVPGQQVRFTLVVRNAGPSTATGVTVTDQLNAGLLGASATVTSGTCSISSGNALTCSVGSVGPDAAVTVTVTATLSAAFTGQLTNTAVVSSPTPDPVPDNNRSTVTGNGAPSADLGITKTISPSTPVPGQPVVFILTITNAGPSTGTAVTVADQLNAALSDVTATASVGTCAVNGTNALSCSLGSMNPGDTVTVRVSALLAASYTGSLSNTATVTSPTSDPDAANNRATVSGTSAPSADITLTKTVSPANPVPGRPVTFTLTARNAGPSTAAAATLSDALNQAITGATATTTSGTCAVDTDNVLACGFGSLTPGAVATVTVTGVLAPSFTGTLTNTAVASTTTADPNAGNDTATVSGLAAPSADVSIVKTTSPTAPIPGSAISFTMAVRNAGPSVAGSVVVTDQLDPAISAITATADNQTSCSVSAANLMSCPVGTIGPNAVVTVSVTGTLAPNFTGVLANTGRAASATADPDPTNNVSTVTGTAAASADVSVVKSMSPTAPIPGRPVTFSMTVRNAGPSVSTAVTLTDQLAAELSGATVTTTTGTCAVGTDNALTCTLGTLAPGAVVTVQVTSVLDAAFTGTLSNTSSVASPTSDPVTGNNSSTVSGVAAPSANLSITKSLTPARPVPGQATTFVLSVRNAGPSVATGVAVADQVDPALTGVNAVSTAGTCTVTANRVACALGALAPGATATVTVTGTLDPAYTGTLSNTATVDSPTSDPNTADNTSTVTGTVAPSADVSITKTVSPTTPVAGQPVSFTLTVRNTGPSVARSITVADELDPALNGAGATSTQGTCAVVGRQVDCALGDLAPGATPVVVTITSTVAPDFSDTLTNTGTVATTTPDPNPDNNTATATGGITASADVSVIKTMSPTLPIPGSAISFTLVVHNDGPSTATGLVVTDRLNAAITAITATADDGSTCTVAGGNVLTCPLAPLNPGGPDVTVSITGSLAPDFTGQLSNTASVSVTTPDADPDDNSSTVTGVAAPSADVVLTKSVTPVSPVPGQPVTYTVTARNAGPSTAADVVVVDQVSTALTDVVATPTSGSCSVDDTNLVTCAVGSLAPGATTTVTIRGELVPSFTGTLANTASVSSATPDPSSDNNRASADATTAPSADLSVVKRVTPAVPVPGQAMTYTLAVHNDGPSTAASVSLVDDLVPDLQGATATTAGGSCTVSAGNTVECTLGALAPGADAAVTVRATLAPDFTGTLANTATVSSPTPDPVAGNNSDAVTGDALPSADVSVTKTLGPQMPVPGQEVTFTISVENAGPSTARAVEVTDELDPALLDVDVDSSVGACDLDGAGTLTCLLGAIDPDDDPVTIIVTATLSVDFVGTLSNTARAASPTPDPDPDNNVGTVAGDAAPSANLSITKTLDPDAPVPGQGVTYTLTVDNDGPSVAAAVTLRDQLDDALTDVTVTTSGGTCDVDDDGLLTCELGRVAPTDDPVTITVTADLAADFSGTLSNTATVDSPTDDPDPADNSATVSGISAPSADLAVTKTLDPAVPVPGEQVTFTITVTNQGPSTATDVVVSDQLDPRLGDIEADPGAGTCEVDAGLLECSLGDLAPGAPPLTVVVSALLAPDATGDLANTATVTSPVPDPQTDDNTSTVTGTSAPSADLSVTKTVDPVDPVPGAEVRFTITVDNAGPSTAADVVVTDQLDAALGSLDVTTSVGTCEPVGIDRVLSCDVGSVDVGDDPVIIIVAAVLADDFTGDLTNTAVVASQTPDPNEDDNSDTVTAGASPVADLVLTKTVDAPVVVAGDQVGYTITVRNDGPSRAIGVVMTDRLPVELLDAVGTVDPGACATPDADRRLTCELGDLSAGAEVVVTVRADIAPGAFGTITNTATATSDTDDPDGDTVVATATTEAVQDTDVSLTKSVSTPTGMPGEVLIYTLRVEASGPSTARDVVVTDRLPAGLSLVGRPTTDQGTCLVRGSTVTCDLGDLAAGEGATVTLRARVEATSGTVVNKASVSTARGDRDPSNDVSAVEVRVADASIPPPVTDPPSPPSPPPGLSWTGLDPGPRLWLALSLMVGGCVLVLGSRARARQG